MAYSSRRNGNPNYKKGRRIEHKVRSLLERAGFTVTRAAGSKGIVDLVAWDRVSVLLVQVKGNNYCSEVERETFRLMPAPPNAQKRIYRWPDRARDPIVTEP